MGEAWYNCVRGGVGTQANWNDEQYVQCTHTREQRLAAGDWWIWMPIRRLSFNSNPFSIFLGFYFSKGCSNKMCLLADPTYFSLVGVGRLLHWSSLNRQKILLLIGWCWQTASLVILESTEDLASQWLVLADCFIGHPRSVRGYENWKQTNPPLVLINRKYCRSQKWDDTHLKDGGA